MSSLPTLRKRHSIQYIQHLYTSNVDRSKLENLIRAFRGIQALPPDNEKSFYYIAGLHGLPYRGPGIKDPKWWGGYCWHDTVLFPTWHRIYLLYLEDALRSIPGCQDVTLPFWDELIGGKTEIPSIFTSPTFNLDGLTNNPLYSYKLQQALKEEVQGTNNRYSKHKGYETVRYPLSGLVGTKEAQQETNVHNAKYKDQEENVKILNANVKAWLEGTVKIPDDGKGTRRPDTYSVYARYIRCLLAPNYTVFSNAKSANAYNSRPFLLPGPYYVVSLESPHNAIHLAVGGFYQEGKDGLNANPIRGANGDMGDNETAGFDPIFFFHHCFVDYTFSIWQRLHKRTKRGDLTINKGDPGTILEFGQPLNFPPGTTIDLSTPLLPFKKSGDKYYTSDDATDLSELGITYSVGSLDPLISNLPKKIKKSDKYTSGDLRELAIAYDVGSSDPVISDVDELVKSEKSPFDIISPHLSDPTTLAGSNPNDDNPFSLIKRVHNIRRTEYEGSFVIRLYAKGVDGKEYEVGREPVLSRWNIDGCRNCQSHLDVDLYVPLDPGTLEFLEGPTGQKVEIDWRVKIQTRDKLHEFPTGGPDEERGGEKFKRPKIDDLPIKHVR